MNEKNRLIDKKLELGQNMAIPQHLHAIFAGRPVAFVTTMRPDGHMSTNPMSVLFDGTTIRLSTLTKRKKCRNLLTDNRITLCVVQGDNLNRYVEIRGRATIEPDTDRNFVNNVLSPRYLDVKHYPFDEPGDERVVITVIPEQISSPTVPLDDAPPYAKPE